MQTPSGKLDTIQALAGTLLAACTASATDAAEPEELPALAQAFEQLAEVMTRLEADTGSAATTPADVTEIGEYALRLCEGLAACLERQQLRDERESAAVLVINVALWVAQHEGQIDTLEPVVDALALLANTTRDPHLLEALSGVIRQLVAAVSPTIGQDLEKFNPGRPWRVLLLNQSIIATRSHNTELMEQAFAVLTSNLPEDAGRFFSEGMQQMDALDYPEQVRKVMAKYHRQWTLDRSLH
jgi:tellurite resistance protein